MKLISLFGTAFLSLMMLGACITEDPHSRKNELVKVGDVLPEFEVVTSEGLKVSRDSLLGRRSMVVFFNTRCGDCRVELPRVDSVYRHFQDEKDFILVCISREEEEESISYFWNEKKLVMPYVAQKDRGVYNLFAKTVIPRIYISSPDGVVRYTHDDRLMPSYASFLQEIDSLGDY